MTAFTTDTLLGVIIPSDTKRLDPVSIDLTEAFAAEPTLEALIVDWLEANQIAAVLTDTQLIFAQRTDFELFALTWSETEGDQT